VRSPIQSWSETRCLTRSQLGREAASQPCQDLEAQATFHRTGWHHLKSVVPQLDRPAVAARSHSLSEVATVNGYTEVHHMLDFGEDVVEGMSVWDSVDRNSED